MWTGGAFLWVDLRIVELGAMTANPPPSRREHDIKLHEHLKLCQ